MYTLITGAASSKAYQLKNKLDLPDILLGDYLELPAVMISAGHMIILPNPMDTAYAHKMLALCLDKQIHAIYVLRDKEYPLLAEASQLFEEYGIGVFSG